MIPLWFHQNVIQPVATSSWFQFLYQDFSYLKGIYSRAGNQTNQTQQKYVKNKFSGCRIIMKQKTELLYIHNFGYLTLMTCHIVLAYFIPRHEGIAFIVH